MRNLKLREANSGFRRSINTSVEYELRKEVIYMPFGEKLRQRRDELGLTQEDVGANISAELSRQAVSKWERDEAYPEVEKLLVLATELDISLDALFADELAYLKRNKKSGPDLEKTYPGLITGLRTFAEALENLKK